MEMLEPFYAGAILVAIAELIYFLIKGRRSSMLSSPVWAFGIFVLTMLLLLDSENSATNDCCGGWSLFSPKHFLSIFVLIFICAGAYFYCALRKKLAPPLIEVIINSILLAGIALNIFIGIQIDMHFGWILLIPHHLLLIMMLVENHQLLMSELEANPPPLKSHRAVQFCWFLLRQPFIKKFPVLLVLCLPVIVCLAAVLLLFGQQPDSLVRVFTETYRHGLSQLHKDCNAVVCGGHFLCTIAAKGSPGLVKPLRTGVRAGAPIKCNRQLLVSNAFEEWLEQHVPWLHTPVRRLYNHVGSYLHRHYGAFDRKWVSNLVYLLMKPLEWIFLLALYMLDRRPETRIAQQYMRREDREKIKYHLTSM